MYLTIEEGHLFPFLHKNLDLKYKTWLGGHTFFDIDIAWKYKFQSQNLLHKCYLFQKITTFHWKHYFFDE